MRLKFSKDVSIECQKYLLNEYLEYVRITPMTKEERKAVRDWVKAGNSVYTNNSMAYYESGRPLEYLKVYREEEYIRKAAKKMSSEERRNFALDYMGWNIDSSDDIEDTQSVINDNNLPFPY